MRVALIGDIHGNLPALEAVLTHAGEQGAEAVWNVGDFVGFGPFPDEVVQRLRKDATQSTIGRLDRRVLRFKKRSTKWRKSKPLEEYLAYKFAYENLSKSSRKYLRFLSGEIRMRVCGHRVMLTHTGLGLGKRRIGPDSSEKRLRQIAEEAQTDILVCGCSHVPFVHQVDGVWLAGPGSIGLPGDGDPRASYAMLRIEVDSLQVDSLQVDHFRVDYDLAPLVAAIRERKLPEAFVQMFEQGLDLEAVLEDEDDE